MQLTHSLSIGNFFSSHHLDAVVCSDLPLPLSSLYLISVQNIMTATSKSPSIHRLKYSFDLSSLLQKKHQISDLIAESWRDYPVIHLIQTAHLDQPAPGAGGQL